MDIDQDASARPDSPMILAPRTAPRIAGVGTAFPAHVVDGAAAVEALCRLFPGEDREKVRSMVDRSGVDRRAIVPTLDQVFAASDFTARNGHYHRAAIDLATRACQAALDSAGMLARDVDVLIDVSCTGIAIPALDVSIAPAVGLRPDVRRIPITEAGCAGGALALNIAAGLAQSGARVLIVAVELCSLSLVGEDQTRTNLVAALLFGDGAAAALVIPNGTAAQDGPRIEATRSQLLPDTREVMGFDVGAHGLRIVLERELPVIVAEKLPMIVEGFLADCGRTVDDLGVHLVHPGGRAILEAYRERFGLPEDAMRFSRRVLAEHGNLSSASVLAVLGLALEERAQREAGADDGLLVAIGPGLSFELALLRWD